MARIRRAGAEVWVGIVVVLVIRHFQKEGVKLSGFELDDVAWLRAQKGWIELAFGIVMKDYLGKPLDHQMLLSMCKSLASVLKYRDPFNKLWPDFLIKVISGPDADKLREQDLAAEHPDWEDDGR